MQDEIFKLLEAKTNRTLSWAEKCRQTQRAIQLMRQENMKEHEQYIHAIQSYAVQVGESQEGSAEEAKQWLLEWIELHPEDLEEASWCYKRIAYVCEKRDKNVKKAIQYFEKRVEIIQKIYGEESDYAGDELYELAKMYACGKDMKNAWRCQKKYIKIYCDVSDVLQKYPKPLRLIVLSAIKVKEYIELIGVFLFKKYAL